MKFTIQRNPFLEAIGHAKPIACGLAINVSRCVRIEATESSVTITASDNEMWLTQTIEANCEPGVAYLSAEQLSDVLARTTGDEVTLSANESVAIVAAKNITAKIHIAPIGGLNLGLPIFEPTASVEDETGFLSSALRRALVAAPEKGKRPNLEGVNMRVDGGNLVVECSNGVCLHVVNTNLPVDGTIDEVMSLPCAEMAKKLITGQRTTISLSDTAIQFRIGGGVTLISRLLAIGYPPTTKIIPKKTERAILATRSELLAAIDATSAIREPDEVYFTATDKGVSFWAEAPEAGRADAEEIIGNQNLEGTFIVRRSALRDAVALLTGEQVSIENIDQSYPIAIRENDFTAVILPMRRPINTQS